MPPCVGLPSQPLLGWLTFVLSTLQPRKKLKTKFWNWLEQRTTNALWVFSGDFNMVDLPKVSKGKSTYIRGGEERI